MKTISFVIEKDFINSSGDLKKAYLNGCKFVAKKILNNKFNLITSSNICVSALIKTLY